MKAEAAQGRAALALFAFVLALCLLSLSQR
jgi:hypothetical protein